VGGGAAALLRLGVRRRRGELLLLRDSRPPHRAPVGRADSAGLRISRQGMGTDDGPPSTRAVAARRHHTSDLATGPPNPSRRDRGGRISAGGARRGVPALPRGAGTAGRGGQARLRLVPARAVGALRRRTPRVPRLAAGAAAWLDRRRGVPPSLVAA